MHLVPGICRAPLADRHSTHPVVVCQRSPAVDESNVKARMLMHPDRRRIPASQSASKAFRNLSAIVGELLHHRLMQSDVLFSCSVWTDMHL